MCGKYVVGSTKTRQNAIRLPHILHILVNWGFYSYFGVGAGREILCTFKKLIYDQEHFVIFLCALQWFKIKLCKTEILVPRFYWLDSTDKHMQ